VLRPLVAPDVHDVAEAARRDHARGRAAILQRGIRRDRRAVVNVVDAAIGAAVRQTSPTPRMNARDGSSGVLATLCVSVRFASVSVNTTSVNVPPTSTPIKRMGVFMPQT
jgi:hypothetical protein